MQPHNHHGDINDDNVEVEDWIEDENLHVISHEFVVLQNSRPADSSEAENQQALAVYQPPVVQHPIVIGWVLTVFGPELPPVMHIPKGMPTISPFKLVVLSKRSWDVSFSYTIMGNKLVYHQATPRKIVTARPKPSVARAL